MTRSGVWGLSWAVLSAILGLCQLGKLNAQDQLPKVPGLAAQDQVQQPKTPAQIAGQVFHPPPPSPVLTLTADPDSPFEGQNVHFAASWNQSVLRASYRFEWGNGEYFDSDLPRPHRRSPKQRPSDQRQSASAS
jgi:hypothetical protein